MGNAALSGNLRDESGFDRFQGNGTLFSGVVHWSLSCSERTGSERNNFMPPNLWERFGDDPFLF